ncbi:hypothetical protein JW707_03630 [Candidatus Woesearchaeota archaeon]|nr:hypothetical protein [Candidatus Woesearchaeota archaeon]
MKVVFSQEIPEKEFVFESDSHKFLYLEDKLRTYRSVDEYIGSGAAVKYDLVVTRPDRKSLYFNGAEGRVGQRFCGSKEIIPFTSFLQDLVCLRALFGVHDSETPDAERFESNLLDYVIFLYGRHLIPNPEVDIAGMDDKKRKKALEDLQFSTLSWPATFIDKFESLFFNVWMPKLRDNTGEYNPNHMLESSYLKVLE